MRRAILTRWQYLTVPLIIGASTLATATWHDGPWVGVIAGVTCGAVLTVLNATVESRRDRDVRRAIRIAKREARVRRGFDDPYQPRHDRLER